MRNGLITAIVAIILALGIGAFFASYHGVQTESASRQGTLTEGRAATTSPSNPGEYVPPAQPAPPNEGEPGPATIR
jgi:hypothetical protein